MVEQPPLVTRHEIVADLGQKHGLAVGGEPAQDEGGGDAAADQHDQIVAAVIEDAVDDILHDPGDEGGGAGHRDQAQHGETVMRQIFAAVLAYHATQDRDDFAGIDRWPVQSL